MTTAQILVVVLALIAANLPFFTQRILWVRLPVSGAKNFGWRLLELLIGYFVIGGVSALLESRAHGGVYPQHWEFYAATLFLFLVFAFPGFTIRFLWRERRS